MWHCVESRREVYLVNEDRFLCAPELPFFASCRRETTSDP
jgi:hypothetical protein